MGGRAPPGTPEDHGFSGPFAAMRGFPGSRRHLRCTFCVGTLLEKRAVLMVPVTRIGWQRGDGESPDALINHEWLVTNGLGGYASGTLAGVVTRRYHGLLVA